MKFWNRLLRRSSGITTDAATKERDAPAALVLAALADDSSDSVRTLFERHPEFLASRSEWGETPLHLAAARGNVQATAVLLDLGADVGARDADGATPLHRAVRQGSIEIAKLLLARGADPSAEAERGVTALTIAIVQGHKSLADHLGSRGNDVVAAAASGDSDKVCVLLAADPALTNCSDRTGFTPLQRASANGHIGCVALLLAKGAERNAISQNRDRATALHFAAAQGHLEIVNLLIQLGANVEAEASLGWKPLHSAASGGHLTVVESLLRAGANPAAEAQYLEKGGSAYSAFTPLDIARAEGRQHVITYLQAVTEIVNVLPSPGIT